MASSGAPPGTPYGVWVTNGVWIAQKAELKKATDRMAVAVTADAKKGREIERLQDLVRQLQDERHVNEGQTVSFKSEVDKVNSELGDWKKLIDRQRHTISLQDEKVREVDAQVASRDRQVRALESKCDAIEKEVEVKDKTITHLHGREQALSEQLAALEHLHHRAQASTREIEEHCQAQEMQVERLQAELAARTEEVEDVYATKRANRELQVDVDRLKVDNARVVKMLKSTAEYRDFVRRSYERSDMAYIQHGSPLIDLKVITEDYRAADDRPLSAESEGAHWMPASVYKYAEECRHRYMPGVDQEVFGNFLHAMHQKWRQHERKVLTQRELDHDRAIQAERRRVDQLVPYDVAKLDADVKMLRASQRRMGGPASIGGGGAASSGHRRLKKDAAKDKDKLLSWSLAQVETLAAELKSLREERM